jgi:HlyD family secretion protein
VTVRSSLKRTAAALAVIAAAASAGFLWSSRGATVTVRAAGERPAPAVLAFASLGRVEGLSETAQVGAATDGILKAIYVNESQFVRKGTLLGKIGCDDLSPMLQGAIADGEAARQSKIRLLRGARDEEKNVAVKKTAAARVTFEQATSNLERQRILYDGGQIARAAYDQALRDWGVAQADFEAAARTEQLLAAPALPEETAKADAEIAAAEAGAQAARERIRKCSIFAPMDGTVLRVYGRVGESFSTVTPRPLFAIADASGRRVKAEVDERDLGKVEIRQKVAVQADGFPGRTFTGTVASISSVIGSKKILSDDPSDQVDRQVVEATVSLENDAQQLPIGLRVTVQFFSRQARDRANP